MNKQNISCLHNEIKYSYKIGCTDSCYDIMNIENIRLDKFVEVKAIGKAWGGGLWVTDDGPGMIKDVLKLAVVMVV